MGRLDDFQAGRPAESLAKSSVGRFLAAKLIATRGEVGRIISVEFH